jgi:hypothetical protein
MTDFKRLIDEVDSDLARAVLSSGRLSTGNTARKKQVLTALGVGLVIGTTNKISMAALSTWQKVMFIGGVACVGAGGAMTYTHLAAPSDAPSYTAAPSHAVTLSDAVALSDAVVQPASESNADRAAALQATEPQAAARLEPAVVSPATPAAVFAPVSVSQSTARNPVARESSVKAELGLLEQARASLSGGSASSALQVLARYSERHPRGSMRLEAEVLKVEALAAAGRTQEASRLADRVLLRNPKSVVASRLRRFASKD